MRLVQGTCKRLEVEDDLRTTVKNKKTIEMCMTTNCVLGSGCVAQCKQLYKCPASVDYSTFYVTDTLHLHCL